MNKPIPTLTETQRARFDASFVRGEGCWNWVGRKYPSGYGRVSLGSSDYRAHRVSYAFHCEVDPGEKLVCHSCDNPACVNPDHLWLGTHRGNTQDMIRKGRSRLVPGFKGVHPVGQAARPVPATCPNCGHHRTDDFFSGKWRACRPCHLRRCAERKRALAQ